MSALLASVAATGTTTDPAALRSPGNRFTLSSPDRVTKRDAVEFAIQGIDCILHND